MDSTVKLIFELLVIIELIIFEQIFILYALKWKCNLLGFILTNIFLIVLIVLLMVFIISKNENYGDGGGRNLIFGLIFILPTLIFSKTKIKDKIIIIFSGFSYGLLIYMLALRMAYFFDLSYLALVVFIIQTLIHCLVIVLLYTNINKFKLIRFDLFNDKIKTRLMIVVFLSFFLIICFNSTLTRQTTLFLKLLTVVLLIAFIIFSFILIYELWIETHQNENLSNQIMIDGATNLKNRVSFHNDIEKLISDKQKFSLVYIDLDKFKSINDNYGHIIGDKYLQNFANILIKNETIDQTFYRMSGDEFCCLTMDLVVTMNLLDEMLNIEYIFNDIKFLGFSYGISNFPIDKNTETQLLYLADLNMYKDKKNRYSKKNKI